MLRRPSSARTAIRGRLATVATGRFFRALSSRFSQNPVLEDHSMAVANSSVKPKIPTLTKAQKDAAGRQKKAQRAAVLMKQVSDPTRLLVIVTLTGGEKHVGAMCEVLGQSQPALSHHLALLRHGGIISPRRQGKNNFYSLTETGAALARVV